MEPAITIDPEIRHGAPCFAGTRVPVKALFDFLSHGRTTEYFLEQFPTVTRDQVLAVLALVSDRLPELARGTAA
jgi:uncharacterized protein (DUF433 family)